MVNYGRLYALRRHIEQLGFTVTITSHSEPMTSSNYVGFEVDGINSYGCWERDEQIAANRAAQKLADTYSALTYWTDKSK